MNAFPFSRPTRPTRPARSQRGFVLVTGLLFLVVVTLLGLALFRSSGLMERLSANTRDKQRAFESAQAALQYGEWFIGNSTSLIPVNCMTPTAKTVATLAICNENLPTSRDTLATLGWKANAFALNPTQLNLAVGAGGGLVAPGGDVIYQAVPGVYIEDMGLMSDGKSELYQITAYGSGGNQDTSSIVRSTYKVTSSTTCLSCNP